MRASLARACRALFNQERGITRRGARAIAAAACRVEALEARELFSTYYVSNSGNDGAGGTEWNSAWKSIDRINRQQLKPGDNVLFQGGGNFGGSLYIPSKEGGKNWSP